MAYNKSTVGVLVYLYISFIAIVGLLALIQPSHGAEAIDDVHTNELSRQEEKDEHSLPHSLSHDLQDGNREQQKENENNNNKHYQQNQQHEQVNHEKDLMSQQGHLLQEPPSIDADVLQQQQQSFYQNAKEESNSPVNESSLTMIATQQQEQQVQQQQQQQQQPSAVKSPVRVECKMLHESEDESPGVRLVNSSQIFSYLDRIHGTVVDVNDTKSDSSSINNNTTGTTTSGSSNFSNGMNSGNSDDGSEKMSTSSKSSEEVSDQGQTSSEVVITNTGESNVTQSNVQDGEKVTVNASNQASHCALVLFYYPWCIFSAKAAPAFNAIGRIFPQIRVLALDAYADTGLNMRFGLVGVPTILFFHNSKLIAKYNDSSVTLEGLVTFINKITGLTPVDSPVITQPDLLGPVPTTPIKTVDFVVVISWIFVLLCATFFFVNSSLFAKLIECIRNNWREAQAAQHQHTD